MIHEQIEVNSVMEPVCEACRHRDNCIIRKLGEGEVAGTLSENITPKGGVILSDKDSGDFIHVLKSGSIKVALKTDLEKSAFGFYFPLSVFLFSGLLARESKHIAIALEQTRICKIPITTMLKNIGKNPELYSKLLYRFRAKVDTEMHFSETIFGKKSTSKIAGFILYISHKNNKNDNINDEITLTMNRVEISNYLGITPEGVSRAFKSLARKGVIDVSNKKISINKFSELEDIYNAD
jgi:CRP/FNR family transcriptional regulator